MVYVVFLYVFIGKEPFYKQDNALQPGCCLICAYVGLELTSMYVWTDII